MKVVRVRWSTEEYPRYSWRKRMDKWVFPEVKFELSIYRGNIRTIIYRSLRTIIHFKDHGDNFESKAIPFERYCTIDEVNDGCDHISFIEASYERIDKFIHRTGCSYTIMWF
jgi:hypothetical protein